MIKQAFAIMLSSIQIHCLLANPECGYEDIGKERSYIEIIHQMPVITVYLVLKFFFAEIIDHLVIVTLE